MAKEKKAAPTSIYRDRRSFAKIPDVMDVPNLIAIQTENFNWFMNEGLKQAFADISPIENSAKTMYVEFGEHEFGEPKFSAVDYVTAYVPESVSLSDIEVEELRLGPSNSTLA